MSRLLALGISAAGAAVAVHRLPVGFLSADRLIAAGIRGDQSFYLWAIERAQDASHYSRYILNCDWSPTACFDLRAVPQEWNALYAVGTVGRWLGAPAMTTLFWWYLVCLILNVLAITVFVATVIRQPGVVSPRDPLARRTWLIASAVAVGAGLQESVVVRVAGHFPLAAIWPTVLALAFFWRTLEAVIFEERRLAPNLTGLVAALPVMLSCSFYYSVFGLVLFPVTLLSFVISRSPRAVVARLTGRRLRLACFALLAVVTIGALSLYPSRYIFLGTAAGKHAATFVRADTEVRLYSARWADFVRPWTSSGAYAVVQRLGIPVGAPELDSSEMHSFLGVVLLAAIAIAAGASARRWRRLGGPASTRDHAFVLFVGGLVVAFFATVPGGMIIHRVVPAMRCFARMAPFVALFGVAFVARACLASPRWKLLAALLFVGFVVETSSTRFLNGQGMSPTAWVEPVVERLAHACQSGPIALSPRAPDFMFGPYMAYYLSARAHCPLEGIGGPGAVAFAHPPQVLGPSAVFRWDDRDPYLPPIDYAFHPPIEISFADGSRLDLRGMF